MANIQIRKGSVGESIDLRFIKIASAAFAETIDETTEGIELWYRRESGPKVFFEPAALASLESPWVSGGIENIGDGYVRVDVPDAAFDFGAENVLVGGSATGYVSVGLLIELTAALPAVAQTTVPVGTTQVVECSVLLPEAPDATRDGCPIVTKRRHIPMMKGVCGDAVWQMRFPNGRPANFADCVEGVTESVSVADLATVKVRFQGCDRTRVLAEVDGEVLNAETGAIQFPIPACVCQNAGLYQFQAALMDGDSPTFIDGGLISVEPGMWGNTANMGGPPTIEEIRMHLRDRPEENSLLGEVEFDDAEILEAIRQPVREFNESPPTLHRRFNCNNFPYRYNWMNAIVGHLMRTAALSYLRNKLQAVGPGLSVDSKNKDEPYLRFAQFYREEWKQFIINKKCELNAAGFWGSIR